MVFLCKNCKHVWLEKRGKKINYQKYIQKLIILTDLAVEIGIFCQF
jgi:hypothetical protein